MSERIRRWWRGRRGEPTYKQLTDEIDGLVIQRDDLRERLDRIRAAAESDRDLYFPLRSFLLRETEPGWLHVTPEMIERLRTTGSHHGCGDVDRGESGGVT